MVITDRYDHVVDDKNRLAIPSQVRNVMDPEKDGTAFYAVPEAHRYLQLIPEKLFERLAGMVPAGLQVPLEMAKARRLLFGAAPRLELDKQGRVGLPDRFMRDGKKRVDPFDEAILGREVTLVGVGDRLELWNRDDWRGHLRELYADQHSVQQAARELYAPLNGATQVL